MSLDMVYRKRAQKIMSVLPKEFIPGWKAAVLKEHEGEKIPCPIWGVSYYKRGGLNIAVQEDWWGGNYPMGFHIFAKKDQAEAYRKLMAHGESNAEDYVLYPVWFHRNSILAIGVEYLNGEYDENGYIVEKGEAAMVFVVKEMLFGAKYVGQRTDSEGTGRVLAESERGRDRRDLHGVREDSCEGRRVQECDQELPTAL